MLMARRVPGRVSLGHSGEHGVGLPLGVVHYQGFVEHAAVDRADVPAARYRAAPSRPAWSPSCFVFFFLALFDSVGTLVGVGEQAGLMRDGTLPRARQALLADAVGTVAGAALGTSTVTAYIESGAGVAAGGRTGLASLVTAALFLLSLFLYPLVRMIGGGYRRRTGDALSGHRRAADSGRHDDDRRPASRAVGAIRPRRFRRS